MGIVIGTSGYDYPEWVGEGRFYPAGLQARRLDWLTYYASCFSLVELNFTYYGETNPKQMQQMISRVDPSQKLSLLEGEFSPRADFSFVIKAYASLTHQLDRYWQSHAAKFVSDIAPLIESGKLTGVLAQFPSSFRPSTQTATYTVRLAEALAPVQLIVEFRHRDWFGPRFTTPLMKQGVVVAGVDAPRESRLPSFIDGGDQRELTTNSGPPFAYLRLHGRNEGMWWKGDAASRYEYDYGNDSLRILAQRLLSLSRPIAYVAFNNHRHASAARNAKSLGELLDSLGANDA